MLSQAKTLVPSNSPAPLGRMIRLAGARPSDRVTLLGGDIEDLIALARRGFSRVSSMAREPAFCSEPADIVLVASIASTDALAARLKRLRRTLQDGGMMVIYDERPWVIHRVKTLWRLLTDHGFSPLVQVPCGDGYLLSARKRATVKRQQAA